MGGRGPQCVLGAITMKGKASSATTIVWFASVFCSPSSSSSGRRPKRVGSSCCEVSWPRSGDAQCPVSGSRLQVAVCRFAGCGLRVCKLRLRLRFAGLQVSRLWACGLQVAALQACKFAGLQVVGLRIFLLGAGGRRRGFHLSLQVGAFVYCVHLWRSKTLPLPIAGRILMMSVFGRRLAVATVNDSTTVTLKCT